jgi:hypothetical protein
VALHGSTHCARSSGLTGERLGFPHTFYPQTEGSSLWARPPFLIRGILLGKGLWNDAPAGHELTHRNLNLGHVTAVSFAT